jgi:hypothetical protein
VLASNLLIIWDKMFNCCVWPVACMSSISLRHRKYNDTLNIKDRNWRKRHGKRKEKNTLTVCRSQPYSQRFFSVLRQPWCVQMQNKKREFTIRNLIGRALVGNPQKSPDCSGSWRSIYQKWENLPVSHQNQFKEHRFINCERLTLECVQTYMAKNLRLK